MSRPRLLLLLLIAVAACCGCRDLHVHLHVERGGEEHAHASVGMAPEDTAHRAVAQEKGTAQEPWHPGTDSRDGDDRQTADEILEELIR